MITTAAQFELGTLGTGGGETQIMASSRQEGGSEWGRWLRCEKGFPTLPFIGPGRHRSGEVVRRKVRRRRGSGRLRGFKAKVMGGLSAPVIVGLIAHECA